MLAELGDATHDRANLVKILERLERPPESNNELLQEADTCLSNSAEAAGDALLNWLFLKDEGEEYDEDDYEDIFKTGTALAKIASILLDISSIKNGITNVVSLSLKQELVSLLKEIYLRNC